VNEDVKKLNSLMHNSILRGNKNKMGEKQSKSQKEFFSNERYESSLETRSK